MPKKLNVMVFSAHNDDHLIGAGGTISEYVKAGREVVSVIFSYGEASHPHFKKEVTIKMRVKEAKRADKVLGIKETVFLGLKEGKFNNEIKEKSVEEKIIRLIKKHKPNRIFTHSIRDIHPDHKSVNKFIFSILKKMDFKGDAYSFNIWTPFLIKRKLTPRMIVDTSKTFKIKMKAISIHKSQWMAKSVLFWRIYLKDFFNGRKNKCRFAEVFFRIW